MTNIPSTLDEAIQSLTNSMSSEDQIKIMDMKEDDFTGGYHFGFGMNIRNDWGLWHDSALALWFKERGIEHPDDMSGIVLTSLYRTITNRPIDLEGQIQYYKDYWAKYEDKPNGPPKPYPRG